MFEYRESSPRLARRPIGCAVGALSLALGFCVFSADGGAAAPRTRAAELPALLASSNVLSEAAMARQSGTGLRPPAIITSEPTGSPRVLLWDELRLGPLIAPSTGGIVTGTGTGK